MKKFLLAAMAAMLTTGAATAQEMPVHLVGARDNDVELYSSEEGENIILKARKTVRGKYSVRVEFYDHPHLNGVFRVMHLEEVELMKFPANEGIPRLTFSYYQGEINGRVKKDFVYRLPFAEGAPRRVSIEKRTLDKDGRLKGETISHVFNMQEGDDVYAMRKGEVVRIEDAGWYLKNFMDERVLRRANKLIVVEHRDGTEARYAGVLDGTLGVEVGDTVYPDTKLGKAGTLDDEHYYIRVAVDYMTAPEIVGMPDFRQVRSNALEPLFLTADGAAKLTEGSSCEAVATIAIITKEMTKREQKSRR